MFDVDEAMKVCRSRGLNILVALSQLEEAIANKQNEGWLADAEELIGAVHTHAFEIGATMENLTDALEAGDATTPTPDSLSEEDTDVG